MMRRTRLLEGVILGAVVYFVGLFLVPSFGPVRELTRTTALSSGDVTQAVYLIVSLTLMFVFSKGKLSSYGFRPTSFKPVLWAILISAGIEIALLVVMMVSVSLFGGPPRMPQQAGQMGMSFQRTFVSVWLVASTCEEFLFRGLLYGYLAPLRATGIRLLGKHISLPVICCALMFGVGHLCLLGMLPPLIVANIVLATTACGLIAGYFRETTGSLIPAVVSHMTFNVVGYGIPVLLGPPG